MANPLSGKREIFSYGLESTYGTPVARTVRLGNNAELEPSNENDFQEVSGAGDITADFETGNKIVRNTFRFVPQNWEFFGKFCIGNSVSAGSAPTTHTFSRASDGTIPSFTLERAIQSTTDIVRIYEGCQVNSWTLTWNSNVVSGGRDNFVQLECDVIAEDVKNGNTTTNLTAISLAGLQARNIILTLNSASKAKLLSGIMTGGNNLDDGRFAFYSATNSRNKGESFSQKATFRGQFVLRYEDDTEFDLW